MAETAKTSFWDIEDSLGSYLGEISNSKPLSAKEEVDLARQIKEGDESSRNRLVEANLRFVVSVAKEYQNRGVPLADLISAGNVGLITAAERFDENKGFKFISYAVWWIRQAILQALAEQSRIVRLPLNRVGILHKIGRISSALEQEFGREPNPDEIAQELDMSTHEIADTLRISSRHLSLDAPFTPGEDNRLLDIIEDDMQNSPDESLMQDSLRDEIARALGSLTDREAEVISLYFGIDSDHSFTLEEIGTRFGLTRERVRQIKEKAIRRLRHTSRSQRLRAYLN